MLYILSGINMPGGLMMNYQLYRFLSFIIDVYVFILFARAISSWITVDRSHPVILFLYNVTEPVLRPIRRVIPPLGMIDLSILVLFFGLHILKVILRSMLGIYFY